LKSPTAIISGVTPAGKLLGEAKLTGAHVVGVVTVRAKVLVAVAAPSLKAVTVTVYVPAGWASVTRTAPVAGSAARAPVKIVDEETVILLVLVGALSGVTVMLPLSAIDVSG
jgi:hypothetical protein